MSFKNLCDMAQHRETWFSLAAVFFAWFAAVLLLQSLGDPLRNEWAGLLAMLLLFCASSRWSFWGVVVPLTAFVTAYSPIGP